MHRVVADKRRELVDLCHRFDVARLDVFGSAARGVDFDATSDVDFLVDFGAADGDLGRFLEFSDALAALLERPIDLVDRTAIAASRNYIRRRNILDGAEAIYAR